MGVDDGVDIDPELVVELEHAVSARAPANRSATPEMTLDFVVSMIPPW
jgi:hypothetical protein